MAKAKSSVDSLCCAPVSHEALEDNEAGELAKSFAALADPTRLRLFSLVASAGDDICACDLIEPSGRTQPTVSHHMRVLVEAGLVERDKRGQWVWYRVNRRRLDGLRHALG